MKTIKLSLIFICFLFHVVNFAQVSSSPKWIILEDLDDRIVYLDTTTTKIKDNQLTAWTQTIYKTAKEFTSLQGKVSKIKTHYLVNTLTRRYSTIGTLYYDNDNRIIGESSSPQITGKEDVFSLPIESNSTVVAILEKANEYVSESNSVQSEDELISAGTSSHRWEDASKNAETDKTKPPVTNTPTENTNTNKNTAQKENNKQQNISTTQVTQTQSSGTGLKIYDPVTNTFVDAGTISNQGNNNVTNNSNSQIRTSSGNYNNSGERIVKGNIWSDGNLYCVQVASYQDRSAAESKAAEINQRGFNSFVVEANIPSKGGIWYRVRIGYFQTLAEAQTEQSKLR